MKINSFGVKGQKPHGRLLGANRLCHVWGRLIRDRSKLAVLLSGVDVELPLTHTLQIHTPYIPSFPHLLSLRLCIRHCTHNTNPLKTINVAKECLMLSRRSTLLPTILLSLACEFSWTQASSDQSFLGDNLVRQNQVQNVLEHEPVKVPGCSHVVRLFR